MDLESDLEKSKYRNWVRGVLAYTYLKYGIEEFTDELVKKEHQRIVNGNNCNQCTFGNLKPKHEKVKEPNTGKHICQWRQSRCNCLYPKKIPCPIEVCDAIFEDILGSHGSTPPSPNWNDTDIKQWCSKPWEIAKCFIKAPGYSDKSSAADIDAPGLLHIFINNTNFHTHISCEINNSDIFSETLKRRNKIFHSPTMELEEQELDGCIDDIIAILEDEKELKGRPEAKQAVFKLKQLKDKKITITTHDEKEACRLAMEAIVKKSKELQLTIDEAKSSIEKKEEEALQNIDEKSTKTLCDAVDNFGARHESQIESMKRTIETLTERVNHIETDNSTIHKHLQDIETNLNTLKEARDNNSERLQYIDQMLALQQNLVTRYETFYTKTSVSPLKSNDDDIDIAKVYVAPSMVEDERKVHTTTASGKSMSREGKTSKEPEESEDKAVKDKKSKQKTIGGYHDILHSNNLRRRKIYIVGDVGTGKSSFCQMMLHNWCTSHRQGDKKDSDQQSDPTAPAFSCENQNVEEMKYFNFLFYISLSRFSGFSSDLFDMIKVTYKDILPTNLIDTLFEKESQKCCILIDGLDEWTPPIDTSLPPHISFGIPNNSSLRNASIIIMSRPSAKGILNLRSSEFDTKIKLLGVDEESVQKVAERYIESQSRTNLTVADFMNDADENFKHLEKSPLLVKQLVWMFCQRKEFGSSVADLYCNIINIMFGWYEKKDEKDSVDKHSLSKHEDIRLPDKLDKFPRCKGNRTFILLLGKLAFEALTGVTPTTIFGRSKLSENGLTKCDISSLTKLGILEEQVNADPTLEQTNFTFIHMSYLEFFAAVYISISEDSRERGQPSSSKRRFSINGKLHEFFKKSESAADILQLSNVVYMICGLSPNLFWKVSRHIYEIVKNDELLVNYKTTLLDNEIYEPKNIQNLLQKCFLLCHGYLDLDSETTISLSDIAIEIDTSLIFLSRIDPLKILSLCINTFQPEPEKIFEWMTRLTNLQVICIFTDEIICKQFDELLNSVKKLDSLQELIMFQRRYSGPLWQRNTYCEKIKKCPNHYIDLSKHSNLVKVDFRYVASVWIRIENPMILETFSLKDSFCHGSVQYEDIAKFIEEAKNLRTLILMRDGYGEPGEMRSIEMSQHFKIENIKLCCYMPIFGRVENLTNIVVFSISDYSGSLDAEYCDRLASFLSNAVSLQSLSITEVYCSMCSSCRQHKIDMSRLYKVQFQEIDDTCFVAVNSKIEFTTSFVPP